jgi:hypothetical protein
MKVTLKDGSINVTTNHLNTVVGTAPETSFYLKYTSDSGKYPLTFRRFLHSGTYKIPQQEYRPLGQVDSGVQ